MRGANGSAAFVGCLLAMMRQVALGSSLSFRHDGECWTSWLSMEKREELLPRNLLTGEIEAHEADAVVVCTGGYSNVFYLSTNAMACAVTAAWGKPTKGVLFLRTLVLHKFIQPAFQFMAKISQN